MRPLSPALLALLLAPAVPAQVTVSVANTADAARPDEVVSVGWDALQRRLPAVQAGAVRVRDAAGTEVPTQVYDTDGDGSPDELLFLASFWAEQTATFTVDARPAAKAEARAHAVHFEPRDDVAWENDRVAFRTYGEGLWTLEDLVSSGIDVWTKRTRKLVVDKWYAGGDYHRDTGEGADFFSVGRTLGAGGTAVWADGRLFPAPNFSAHRVLADGPLRASVELTYGPWDAAGRRVSETRRITIDAGRPVFRLESTFSAADSEALRVAFGLVGREGMVASSYEHAGWTWLSGWGPVERKNGGHGDLGTGLLVASARQPEHVAAQNHHLLVVDADAGAPVVAYVGAGWTGGADVRGVADWWTALDAEAAHLAHPLHVTFSADRFDADAAEAALDAAADRLRPFLARPAVDGEIPRSLEPDGTADASPAKEWTSGFYPGTLWELYGHTGDAAFEDAARRWSAVVEPEKRNGGTHDMGFKIYPAFGAGLALTDDAHYRDVIVEAADTLATRFSPTVGAIKSWDWGKWKYPVIIDNMMNLELLFAATRLTGDSTYYRIADQHAQTTLAHHFRDDASSYHVVQFDEATGEVLKRGTHQGESDASAWSRGQGWALYGFAMAFRETGRPEYLAQARRVADFVLEHPMLPGDGVPYWDFDAPDLPHEPRDASAAAVLASGLYELSGFVPEERARYVAAADRMMASLATDYLASEDLDEPFLLDHSVGSVPGDFEVDVPITYADYYYVEALLRRLHLDPSRAALGARQPPPRFPCP